MVNYLVKDKNEIKALLFHVALGILSLFSVYFFIVWVYLLVFSSLGGIINKVSRNRIILLLSGYFLGMELIGRMLKSSPWIPYQICSYFMLVVFTLGIFDHFKSSKTNVGLIIVLLCVPGFFMISGHDYLTPFIDAFSGILCTGLAAVYFSRQVYTQKDLFDFLKCAVLPIIITLVYLFFKTPSFNDIDFSLKANFKTSGGFGSNQVSTVLGAGACLILLPYLRNSGPFRSFKIINLLLLAGFLFRGLLTFSRGGVMGCLAAVLLAYLYITFVDKKNFVNSILKIFFFAFIAFFIFQASDQITGGKLSERYRGETGGTLEGTREKNLKTITSNRSELIEAEWLVFANNILFGVGPGNGYEARRQYIGERVASHTEVTRLMAEQGLPGLAIAIIFLVYPFIRISEAKSKEEKYYLIGFFSLAIITSFHSGMRTMLTPVLWGLCCARFYFPPKTRLANVGIIKRAAYKKLKPLVAVQ